MQLRKGNRPPTLERKILWVIRYDRPGVYATHPLKVNAA